jgi:hypothetical protein
MRRAFYLCPILAQATNSVLCDERVVIGRTQQRSLENTHLHSRRKLEVLVFDR